MYLKPKLLILFIEISVIPLALVSVAAYYNSKQLLTENTLNNLNNLATIQQKRVDLIVTQNLEWFNSVSNNESIITEIVKLTNVEETGVNDILLTNSLNNTLLSAKSIDRIEIVGLDGKVISSTSNDYKNYDYSTNEVFKTSLNTLNYDTFIKGEDKRLKQLVAGPIKSNSNIVAVLILTFNTTELIKLTNDYTGLGQTGETIIVKKNQDGTINYITPLRFDPLVSLTTVNTDNEYNKSIVNVFNKQNQNYQNVLDYRGKTVYSSGRFFSDTNWGIITKIDTEEVHSASAKLKTLLIFFVLCSSVIVGFISLSVAKYLSSPLQKLKDTAYQISSGVMESEIEVESKDEVGQLATTFNSMTRALKESYTNLENKVEHRTASLMHRQKELEEARAKDVAILQGIGEGLIVYDTNGKILFMNNLAEEMTGYRFNDIKDKTYQYLWRFENAKGEKIDNDVNPYNRVLKERKIISDRSLYFSSYAKKVKLEDDKGEDHIRFPVMYTFAPILINGNVTGVIQVFADITEERQLELLKDEFISIVSHELRTPMTAIKGLVSMILEGDYGDVNDNIKEPLNNVAFSSDRLIHLVNDMLDASSIDAGRLNLNLDDVNAKKIVDDVAVSLNPIIQEKKLVLNKDKVDSVWVQADADKLRQVFNNLIGNAVKFTEKGKIHISTVRDGDNIIFYINDTGIGIPEDGKLRLFKKFQQAGVELNNHKQGTGLGLYITREIIRKMGGELWIENSEVGVGTTFGFTVPASGSSFAKIIKAKIISSSTQKVL